MFSRLVDVRPAEGTMIVCKDEKPIAIIEIPGSFDSFEPFRMWDKEDTDLIALLKDWGLEVKDFGELEESGRYSLLWMDA